MTKVLVAEDNPVNRELLRELLENRGYEVVEACNGQEALSVIDETQPDILLLDISMRYWMDMQLRARSGRMPH
jgi:CheY-like chemotaxis protein